MNARTHWSRLLLVMALALSLLAATACAPAEEEAAAPEEKPEELPELIVAVPSEIQGTDQQQVTTTFNFVHGLISTPPISLGLQNKEVLPHGAKSVEISPDGKEIRLTFDPNRTFHNGVPVTAEAVKRSIERYVSISPYAFDYDPVEEIVVEGDTLILKLKEAGPALLVVLASDYAGPVEVGAAEEMGDEEFNRRTVGCGPYKVEEWVDGSHITLVRNDDYYDFLPFVENNGPFHFSKVTVRFIPEAFTRVSELRAGNVHIITSVPSEMLKTLEEDPNIVLHEYLSPNVRHLQMNTERFPFQDKRVRLAVAYAIDRAEIMEAVEGTIKPLFSLVAEAMISHHPETEAYLSEKYAHDLDKAKQLLAEAGCKDTDGDGILELDGKPMTFTLAISGDNATDKKAGPILQAQLRRVGLDAQVREYESRYLRELIETANFDMILRNWNWLDPGGVWPAGLKTGGRLAPWSHPEVDALLDAAQVIPDEEERAQKWAEVSKRVWEDVPLIPLWSDRVFLATRAELEGLILSVSGTLYLNDLKLKGD